jgi:6-pyruvoyltetrahydropterin/6-carboxytetrahydropterin synthase
VKVHLTRRYLFSASHRLHQAGLSGCANRETYGKCNNPHGHGHNYFLEVTVSGPVDEQTGMLCDLGVLDDVVRREVLDRFDHQNLNLLPEFNASVPTTENLTFAVQRILSRSALPAHLESVRIEETANNAFELRTAPEAASGLLSAQPEKEREWKL